MSESISDADYLRQLANNMPGLSGMAIARLNSAADALEQRPAVTQAMLDAGAKALANSKHAHNPAVIVGDIWEAMSAAIEGGGG